MHVFDYVKMSKYLNSCPNCGSDLLGNGHGTLNVDGSIFKRTCECGFNFKYDVDAGVRPKQIKQAIDEALSKC